MMRAQSDAKYRIDAANLAAEIVGTIWGDKPNMGTYATAPGAACTVPNCAAWLSKVAASLPAGAATITVTPSTGTIALTVTWAPPNQGVHRYAATTQVQ
ncbi:MAG: hypothetical protein NVS2B4_00030 [Ramlibacter sp.]